MPQREALSIGELIAVLQTAIADTPLLNDVWIEGEVSECRMIAGSGHIYLTLKDPATGTQIKATIWRSTAARLTHRPADGQRIRARGEVTLYAARSEYQFNVRAVTPVGIGDLFREFERLKAALAAEGLFDPDRKRPLPAFPTVIGVVTSAGAAAFQDVQNVLRRRWPLAHVILSPTLVQGMDAPPQIVRALERLNAASGIDVILICRGGGSLEDLWAFNAEPVVRAVAASRLPIISGVGHETDFTLTDFAADLRAPTPSAAAELLTPDRAELAADLLALRGRLRGGMAAALEDRRTALARENRRLTTHSPRTTIGTQRQRVDELTARLDRAARRLITDRRDRAAALERTLIAASPQAILERGYALVTQPAGRPIQSAAATAPGDPLLIRFADGTIPVRRD